MTFQGPDAGGKIATDAKNRPYMGEIDVGKESDEHSYNCLWQHPRALKEGVTYSKKNFRSVGNINKLVI